ncbi:MAG: hypothetical protein LAT53_07065 [Idiomarina sp.]|nr:hypothetical protein [Idiomarina sp.]
MLRYIRPYLSTRVQFFIAIAGTGMVLVFLVLFGVRSAFLNNFEAYLVEQEQRRIEQVAAVFSEYYEDNLQRLRRQGVREISEAVLWQRIVNEVQRDALLNTGTLNPDIDLTFSTLSLTTLYGYQVFGTSIDTPISVAVLGEGEVIATLSAPIPQGELQPVDQVFAQQQQRALWWAGALAIVIAAIVAWLLASVLRKRLARLRYSTQQLAAGDYQYPVLTGLPNQQIPDDVGELAIAIEQLAENLANTEHQRRQFMADIAHELRTPLTVLKGELEAVEDGIREPNQQLCKRLQQQTEQLNHLVNDLHTLAQAGAGQLSYHWQPLNMVQFVTELHQQMQPTFTKAGLTLSLHVPENRAFVRADSARLQQVCMNLLNNSLRYTNSPGAVQMHLLVTAQAVELRIEDSAPGVSEAHRQRLFERFYRIDAHRQRASGGSGLGLTIVAQIVQAHGGTVQAEASALGGLRMHVVLPRLPDTAAIVSDSQ